MRGKHQDDRGDARTSALYMSAAEFRDIGHRLIEQIAEFYDSLPERQLTSAKSRSQIRELLGTDGLPDQGASAGDLLKEVAPLIFENSLHNGHPRFLGYISASAAPLGALADLLAASVNANVAKWELSPIASEIETQTVRWIAELIGYPGGCGGIMVSGGNSANFHGFIAARQAAAQWDLRKDGLYAEQRKLTAYVSQETHTWIDKAAEICGLGAAAVRWIDTDDKQRMNLNALREQVKADKRDGYLPFLVVGTAGTVCTGAIDPLRDMAAYCKDQGIWLHVDGAYGAPAASLPESLDDLQALALADSVAVDPHKWLYSPIEAACILTRNPNALRNAFDFRPDYYHFDDDGESGIDYYQHGIQNSRGFRALKVWLGLRRAGREGHRATIREDISLARLLYQSLDANPDFDARTLNLSVVTFRYVPADINAEDETVSEYLNELNKAILAEVQKNGRAFVSNAIVAGHYLLRACVVNFRTTASDIDFVIKIIAEIGKSLDNRIRPGHLAA
ncbi:MAG: pyridoxal phosphate-dependent decarboxylase family protein [Woeseiaceae bacterium]